jgi:hypothetical protein
MRLMILSRTSFAGIVRFNGEVGSVACSRGRIVDREAKLVGGLCRMPQQPHSLLAGSISPRVVEVALVGWNSVSFSGRAALLRQLSYTIRYEMESVRPHFSTPEFQPEDAL